MPSRTSRRKCPRCGSAARGEGPLCARCSAASEPAKTPPGDGFVCPYCRRELSWDTLKSAEAEISIYVREKIYYCPDCRSFLGVASWHTEG